MARTAALRRARERRARRLTLLEGPHLLLEAVAAGAVVVEVFGLPDDEEARSLAERGGAEWIPVSGEVLDRLAPTETPRGPVAVMTLPAESQTSRDVLDLFVGDPGNAGTLIRTAAAFALDVVCEDGAVDPWSPKVLRAGAGAHFRTAIAGALDPTVGRIATVVTGGMAPRHLGSRLDPARRWAVLVGSEAHGLSPSQAARADLVVTIPMVGGTESLNAGVAGSIVAYELSRWREEVGPVVESSSPSPTF